MNCLLPYKSHLKLPGDLGTLNSPFRKAISLQYPVQLGFCAVGMGRSGWRLSRKNLSVVAVSACTPAGGVLR